MVSLLHLSGWLLGLLSIVGLGLGLAMLLFPSLKQWPSNLLQQHLFPDANQITLSNNKKGVGGSKRNVYRILCFGDSLTEGFTSGGVNFHPYAKRLGDRIYAQLPEGWHLEVEEQGESGERVLFSMKHRLQRTLDEHADAARHYDWVLLLGGINDLGGDDSPADEVIAGLKMLTEACLQHGAHVLLMTVMEVSQPLPRVEQQRDKLNKLIQEYVAGQTWQPAAQAAVSSKSQQAALLQQAAAGGGGGGAGSTPVSRRGAPRVVLFDLASKLTWSGMDDETRWQMWDDGVHLTIDGYDLMGDLIVEALSPLVKKEIGSKQADAAAQANGATGGTSGHKKVL